MVKDNVVFGNQKLEWSYEYSQLFCEPWLTKDGTLHILTNVKNDLKKYLNNLNNLFVALILVGRKKNVWEKYTNRKSGRS